MHEEPFDLSRDPALGRELRALLDAGDATGFTASVLARLPERDSLWDVLAGWARPGIAAALVLGAALGFWLALGREPQGGADPAAEVLATDSPLDGEALMGFALGGGR